MSELMRTLLTETGISENDLVRILHTAPRRYKVYKIPKRSGGEREIAQPAREVKLLQRILVEKIIKFLPVHDAAKAYRNGVSIKDNAALHAGSGPILKMDFRDFFPSIKSTDWEKYCEYNNVLDVSDRTISSQILFQKRKGESTLRLSIGSPSSPILCNILLFNFDVMIQNEAEKRGIKYSRYADDLTFSGQRIGFLKDMINLVKRSVHQLEYPNLTINDEKTTFVTASRRRVVTGVTLSNDGTLSIGRERKRLLSAQVHHAKLLRLLPDEIAKLSGLLAYVNVVEPEFIEWLREKYGNEIIEKIRHFRI